MRRKGASVVFVLAILLLLFIFTGMLLFMFAFWEKTSQKYLAGRMAAGYARSGVQRAIWEIDHDDRSVDSFDDAWRTAFSGEECDIDGDGQKDARWFPVTDRRGNLVGRWAVSVVDESGKVNLNASGNAGGTCHEGHTTWEIGLLPSVWGESAARSVATWRYGADGQPGIATRDDNGNAAVCAANRIDDDGDGLTDEPGEGIDEPQEFVASHPRGDDRPYLSPEDAKLVPGIGPSLWQKARRLATVWSYDLNADRHRRQRLSVNAATVEDLRALCASAGYSETEAARIAASLVDFRDADNVPTVVETTSGRVFGIERTPFFNEIEGNLPFRIIPEGEATTVAEVGGHFIELFNPYDEPIDIGGWRISGLLTIPAESAANLISASAAFLKDLADRKKEPDASAITEALKTLSPTTLVLPAGAVIPPRSHYTIGDSIKVTITFLAQGAPVPAFVPMRGPAGCDWYAPILLISARGLDGFALYQKLIPLFLPFLADRPLVLSDAAGNIIEETYYPADTSLTSIQKNDPRMMDRDAWFQMAPTPGARNLTFAPWAGGEVSPLSGLLTWPSCVTVKNAPLATLGELSRVFRGQQWRTLDFWQRGTDRRLVDRLTVVEEPSEPTPGRLNVNTATETALTCLPLVDRAVAAALVAARPFGDISDVLGVAGDPGARGALSAEMAKWGTNGKDDDGDGMPDTEQEKEMVFSRIVNLLTVRSPVYEIIATGQVVRDRNGDGTIDDSEVIAEKRLRYLYDREQKRVLSAHRR